MIRNTDFLEIAKALEPELIKTTVNPISNLPSSILSKGDSIIIDFGNHYVGNLNLEIETHGRHYDAPLYLKVNFCENERELLEDTSNYNGWLPCGWFQQEYVHIDLLPCSYNFTRRYAFRYVKVTIVDCSPNYSVSIKNATVTAYSSADDNVIKPYTGNAELEKLDSVSLRTLHECMQKVFEDGPKRDRRLWIGDLRIQAKVNYLTYKNYELVKRCLYLFAGALQDNGKVAPCIFLEPEIECDDTDTFDYALFFIPTLLDYYVATGDMKVLSELSSIAIRQYKLALECFDENYVLCEKKTLGWCLIDWSLTLEKKVAATSVFIYCAKALVTIQQILKNDTSDICRMIDLITMAMKNKYYDIDKGVFYGGDNKQISLATQIWAILSGAIEGKKAKVALERAEKIGTERIVTPYLYHSYIEALIMVGENKKSYEKLYSYWGGMIKLGADTFWELYNPDNPNETPYGGAALNSYCHAWSCSPSYFLRKYTNIFQ